MSKELEDKFAALVARRLSEAELLTGHRFSELHALIAEKGYVNAARLLLNPASTGVLTYGFKILASVDLLHLSIEQSVLDFAGSGLFTTEQISKAKAQLIIAKMLLTSTDRKRSQGGKP